jgi:hypothetical protein
MGRTFGSSGRGKRKAAARKSRGSRGRFGKTGPLLDDVLPDSTDDSGGPAPSEQPELAPPHDVEVGGVKVPWCAHWFTASDVAEDADAEGDDDEAEAEDDEAEADDDAESNGGVLGLGDMKTFEDVDRNDELLLKGKSSWDVYREHAAKAAPEADAKELKRKITNARMQDVYKKKRKEKMEDAAKNTNKMTTFFQPQVLTMSL